MYTRVKRSIFFGAGRWLAAVDIFTFQASRFASAFRTSLPVFGVTLAAALIGGIPWFAFRGISGCRAGCQVLLWLFARHH